MTKLYHGSPYDMMRIEPRPKPPLGNVVFAQPDEIFAHAYALKTPDLFLAANPSDWFYAVIDASRSPMWQNLLCRRGDTAGGFIYELDPATFVTKTTQFGDELVSETPPRIICRHFVTPEDAMRKGIQLFVVTSPDYRSVHDGWKNGHVDSIAFLIDGYRKGAINWLNENLSICPKLPPHLRGAATNMRSAAPEPLPR